MSKKMLINASHPEENRVAIVVDGILSELDIEIAGQEQTKGNIYKAVVVRVETGLQAAFVDYGAEKMGFLQIGEIHPNLYPGKENHDTKNHPRINELLHRGQEILVQIVKEERGTKGAALTTFLSLAGRYMVLVPDSKTKGVSRKITEEAERKQLKKTMAALDLPERMGYIVRTAGIGKEQEELKRDFDYLVSLYQGIVTRKEKVKAPAQIYQESNLVIRSIRDYFSNEMDEVAIDDSKVYQEAKDFFSLVMPDQVGLVKQHRERRPLFSRFQIEEQIDGLARNQIPLPSGGSIVIDQTEALVAIDVNSGKMSSESGIEATAGKTNLEAAAEVGRQLRLRDLGGLIVIDFIDMRDRKRIREVEQTLRTSLRDDKAKVTVGRISQFGLLEMSRQRIKAVLSVGAYLDCPHCQGKGRIRSIEAQAIALLRQAHAAASKGQIAKIEARTPLDVATYLLNEKRAALLELEKQLNLTISIEGRLEFVPGQVEIELHKKERLLEQDQSSAPISHANQIEEALAAANQEIPAAGESVEKTEMEPTAIAMENPEESSGRKRRRRRRKRSDRKEADSQPTAVPVTAPTDSGEGLPAEAAKEPVTEDRVQDQTIAQSTEAAKPKNRSRRSTRKPVVAKSSEPSTELVAEGKIAVVNEPESKAESKPKRQRTRKSPARQLSTEATPEKQQPAPIETQVNSEIPEAATKPKRSVARKPAAKKKTAELPVENKVAASSKRQTESKKTVKQEEMVVVKTAETNKELKTPATESVPKPAGRTRKKTAAKTEVPPVAATESPVGKTSKSQPKKKATAPKPVKISDPSEVAVEEKPKRRAPRKKTPPKSEDPASAE